MGSMAKRKKTGKSSNSDLAITKTESKASPLLTLPPEIRNLIWKLVFETDTVHLFSRAYHNHPPAEYCPDVPPDGIGAQSLIPSPMPGLCSNFHSHDQPRQPLYTTNKSRGPGPLSWIRANRQVYSEAKAFVQGNLTFHICNTYHFVTFLSPQQEHIFSLSTFRSLSICLQIRIESDYYNGFSFARGDYVHGWDSIALTQTSLTRFIRKVAKDIVPVLRELKLHLFFICKQAQGPRLGQLYRQKNPPKLACVDKPRNVEAFIDAFCDVRPLRTLRAANLEKLSVQFETDTMEHYTVPSAEDRCWCIGRSVDRGSLQQIKLGERIVERLLDLSKKERGVEGS